VFANVSHFHPSLVFTSKGGAYHSGAPNGTLLLKLASTLARNIRLECKRLTLTNTLAYYNTARITAVKVLVQGPRDYKIVEITPNNTLAYYCLFAGNE
jgi:hypothetical protein